MACWLPNINFNSMLGGSYRGIGWVVHAVDSPYPGKLIFGIFCNIFISCSTTACWYCVTSFHHLVFLGRFFWSTRFKELSQQLRNRKKEKLKLWNEIRKWIKFEIKFSTLEQKIMIIFRNGSHAILLLSPLNVFP